MFFILRLVLSCGFFFLLSDAGIHWDNWHWWALGAVLLVHSFLSGYEAVSEYTKKMETYS